NAAGNALNYLGDPRPGVGLGTNGLPDIVWCQVPAGKFIMGNTTRTNKLAADNERPQHQPELAAFAISKYPISNTQFAAFVRDGGYTDQWRYCWTEAGWRWRTERQRTGPDRYGDIYELPNHPIVGVVWYEALAFCNWLSAKLGQPVMLPSEVQWEKAARGTDG